MSEEDDVSGVELDRMMVDLMNACASARVPLPLHREPTELHVLVERVIRRTVNRGRVRIDAVRTPALHVDSYRIERVVANLIWIALERAVELVVRITDAPGWIRVSVTAAGTEIPPCELDRFTHAIIDAHGGRVGHLYFELPTH